MLPLLYYSYVVRLCIKALICFMIEGLCLMMSPYPANSNSSINSFFTGAAGSMMVEALSLKSFSVVLLHL